MRRYANLHQSLLRKRVFSPGLMLLLASSLAACTSGIKVDGDWSNGVADNQSFSNVLVVGVSPDRNVRCAFERALATELRSKAIKATASCGVMASDAQLSREAIEAVVKSISADAVIATRLVAVKTGAKESVSAGTPAEVYYKPIDIRYYGVYGVPVVYADFEAAPSVFSLSGAVELATDVYETRNATKIYSLETRAKNLESRGMALALITPRIAEQLRDDGLIR